MTNAEGGAVRNDVSSPEGKADSGGPDSSGLNADGGGPLGNIIGLVFGCGERG